MAHVSLKAKGSTKRPERGTFAYPRPPLRVQIHINLPKYPPLMRPLYPRTKETEVYVVDTGRAL